MAVLLAGDSDPLVGVNDGGDLGGRQSTRYARSARSGTATSSSANSVAARDTERSSSRPLAGTASGGRVDRPAVRAVLRGAADAR